MASVLRSVLLSRILDALFCAWVAAVVIAYCYSQGYLDLLAALFGGAP